MSVSDQKKKQIVVAAIVGSAFYGGIALLEKALTFWHPSQRGRA